MFQIDSWIGSLPKNSFPELSAMSFTQNQALLQEMDMEVYLITNTVNDKKYVGITADTIDKRFRKHVNDAMLRKNNMVLHKAIRKYGGNSFEVSLLDIAKTHEQLKDLEYHYIKQYEAKVPHGYNLTDGGEGIWGYKFTEEQKNRLSEAHLGQKAWNKGLGNYHSEETLRRMSESQKGKKTKSPSKETRLKIAKALTGSKRTDAAKKKMSDANKRFREDNPEVVKRINEKRILTLKTKEVRQKMSESHIGQFAWNKGQITPRTITLKALLTRGNKPFGIYRNGELLSEYIIQAECIRDFNLNRTMVSRCLKGKAKSHKGYTFKYIGEAS